MQRPRNLNISFRENDLNILQELRRRSSLEFITTSGITIDLIKKGILYEKTEHRTQTGISV